MSANQGGTTHPHATLGIGFQIPGLLLLLVGVATLASCGASYTAQCVSGHPWAAYESDARILVGSGVVLLLIGFVLIARKGAALPSSGQVVQGAASRISTSAAGAESQAVQSAKTSVAETAEKICQKCGTHNPGIAAFCLKCGAAIGAKLL